MALLKAAADALRLDILRVLGGGTFGVQELADIFEVAQPGMSHHLKVLLGAELVEARREGNYIFYRRPILARETPHQGFVRKLLEEIDQQPPNSELIHRVKKIYDDRSRSSREFFEKHIKGFSLEQKRIAELSQYDSSLAKLLDQVKKRGTVLEVGPGEGELLVLLAERFGKVLAMDRSKEMIRTSQRRVSGTKLKNIDFCIGAFEDENPIGNKIDLVVFNMVLHHQASPKETFEKVYHLLGSQGAFLVVDLCLHHQSWVRDSCGDLWLGFLPEDLSEWAKLVGFKVGPQVFQGLKNGFQIQLRLFFK